LDWPKTIPDFDPKAWENYVENPPFGTQLPDHLTFQPTIIARTAVKPFALYFEWSCNLVLIATEVFDAIGDSSNTLTQIDTATVGFGKRQRPYRAGGLIFEDVLRSLPFSPRNTFSRIRNWDDFTHGIRVERGSRDPSDPPPASETDLSFTDFENMRKAQRLRSLTRFIPQSLSLPIASPPHLFSIHLDIFVSEALVLEIEKVRTPGIGFLYPPVVVDFGT